MIDLQDRYQTHPAFMKILDLVSGQNPLQRKRIKTFVNQQDDIFWCFAEKLCNTLNHSFMRSQEDWKKAAAAYNKTCKEILHLQIRFRETGVYPLDDARVANTEIYSQKEVMRCYITSLLFSYLFWPNHYRMFDFFRQHLANIQVDNCLEVGVGHGLFTAEMMQHFPGTKMTLLDISKTSLEIAREMLDTFQLDQSNVHFIHDDYLSAPLTENRFDYLIMGEVLEHVNDASGFLKRTFRLLKSSGKAYISTCANCPAVDHVYHFRNVDEIRSLIMDSGLHIVEDLAIPAERLPEEEWQEKRITVNYCAILEK